MRATPFQIVVVAALSVVAPAAYGAARPSHAAKAAAHAAARPSKKVAEAPRAKHGRHVELAREVQSPKVRHGRHAEEKDAAPVKTKLVHGRRVVVEAAKPVRTGLVHGRRVLIHPELMKTKRVHGHLIVVEPAPKLIARAERPMPVVAPAPKPEPESEPVPALETIHVTHDRKQHFQPEPARSEAGQDEDTPRKATISDFMTIDTPPAHLPPAAALPKPVVAAFKAAAPRGTVLRASPTAGVVVGSRVEVKPVPLMLEQIAPEPLVSLYDKRGRLVVPPALKGSHEVLIHQNVMADSDGLERVQDDGDLSRMRSSRMLVALPESEGLQTDERLPANRRYTRPWTAAFLTAMARAHYARFHSPLQVNSAVRTVEFQHQLIRVNGNAAPAEGETASPHLTGQAVDIAKHGLSMTEIAWLRGYLLPLVQEGKVDVEEEFQQACFHISVYKKYMPQPAGKRTITERRLSGSALAAAIP